MPKYYGGKKTRRISRKMKGGYSSASSYMENVAGTQNQQYERTFTQAGSYGQVPGNVLIGSQGQNAVLSGAPSQEQLALIQRAGMRRMKMRKASRMSHRNKRGGLIGEVVNQAVVPFSLLGLQQTYRKNRSHKKSRKYRR